ncbi:hypothetical protein [Pseudomonas sp. zfem002]|uniref:hypothetical protein n=1 Tax=Pseudomonas sp. zfem002 TaxID=3078197 RepID=UPI0029292F09|nr:hypothetical protein [Pseudomonas sp. zfem002]MDU9389868.1 hypothetical protein [Pseudomonas sp. zfem002]
MSNSMGIASVFVLSSILLSPLAMAEESQAFVAQTSRHQAAMEQSREAFAKQSQDAVKGSEQTASKVNASDSKDS